VDPVAGDLIVEHLDGETLVYDTEQNQAHALSGSVAAEFVAAGDDVSRRAVLRKFALLGAAAVAAGPLVKTIAAPTAAEAQSTCTLPGTCPNCCFGQTACFQGMACVACATAGNACQGGSATCCGDALGDPGKACCNIGAGGNGTCCPVGQICDQTGQCVAATSDRNLKRQLTPVDPRDALALVS
jgi:hypothetical protein